MKELNLKELKAPPAELMQEEASATDGAGAGAVGGGGAGERVGGAAGDLHDAVGAAVVLVAVDAVARGAVGNIAGASAVPLLVVDQDLDRLGRGEGNARGLERR